MSTAEKPALVFGALKTRDTPKQARAVQRIHVILATTADLLADHPVQQISTTMIANHAGIPVSSIYRYFSDVTHVMRELYLQSAQDLRDKVTQTMDDTEHWPGWRDRLHQIILFQRDHIRLNPFYAPLLIHFLSQRSPIVAEDREREYVTDLMEIRWKRGADGFHGGDPRIVAKTVLQIAVTMEDMIAAQPDAYQANIIAEELKTVLGSYLANYLSD